jgi:hypothetical protein
MAARVLQADHVTGAQGEMTKGRRGVREGTACGTTHFEHSRHLSHRAAGNRALSVFIARLTVRLRGRGDFSSASGPQSPDGLFAEILHLARGVAKLVERARDKWAAAASSA